MIASIWFFAAACSKSGLRNNFDWHSLVWYNRPRSASGWSVPSKTDTRLLVVTIDVASAGLLLRQPVAGRKTGQAYGKG
jgi:hypothetical protein